MAGALLSVIASVLLAALSCAKSIETSTPLANYPFEFSHDVNGSHVYCPVACGRCNLEYYFRCQNPSDGFLELLLDNTRMLHQQDVSANQTVRIKHSAGLENISEGRHELHAVFSGESCSRRTWVYFYVVHGPKNREKPISESSSRRKILISYSNTKMRQSQLFLAQAAFEIGGFDEVRMFTPADLPHQLIIENSELFCALRGGGFWAWKPYIANMTLATMRDGDVLVYMDAGMSLLGNIEPLFQMALHSKEGIVVFDQRLFREDLHTKRDVFVEMNLLDKDEIIASTQRGAFSFAFRNGPLARQFAEEWLSWALFDAGRLISDAPNLHGANPPEFFDHRHDQSILSVLSKTWKLEAYPELSEKGLNNDLNMAFPASGQIMWHHRRAIQEWGDLINLWKGYCIMAKTQQAETRLFPHAPFAEPHNPWCDNYRCTPINDTCAISQGTHTYN